MTAGQPGLASAPATSSAPPSALSRRLVWLRHPLRAFRRQHLPDYNDRATTYWFAMVLVGAFAVANALFGVSHLSSDALRSVLLGILAASLSGLFPIRKADAKNGIAAGEVFVFLLLIARGPDAATLASAAEAACISWRLSRRFSSRIAGPAMAAATMSLCGSLYKHSLSVSEGLDNRGSVLLVSLTLVACCCFVVNSLLVTTIGRLKRGEAISLAPVFEDFASLGIAYAASASIAGLVYIGFLQLGMAIVFALFPIVAIFLATHHFYYRRQEADAATRSANQDASRREAEQAARHLQALKASERRFQCTFTDAAIGMALLTLDEGRIVQCNRALGALFGRDPNELVDHKLGEFVDPQDIAPLDLGLSTFKERSPDAPDRELRWHRADGEVRVASIHCSVFAESVEDRIYLIVQLQDVTARRRAEKRLRYIAYNDELTALPNRIQFTEALTEEVDAAKRERDRRFSVLFLDLDRFKVVNDSLGHAAGDIFLKQIAARLTSAIRPGDLVARFGGDEFAVLARGLNEEAETLALARRLQDAICLPLSVQGTPVSSGASIGITSNAAPARTPDEILRDVDIAMYRAKSGGSGEIVFFDPARHANATDRLHLENDLRRAIATGGLSLAYQPIYRVATGQMTGFEALVRWQHPERGPLSPALFIPLAEESGLIAALTDWVIEKACSQLRAWQQVAPAAMHMTMHVNISGTDLQRPEFSALVAHALRTAGLPAACLTLELTESTLMRRFESALASLGEIERTGVRVSIDDFGTGYSSLSYLSDLPFDSLKIDRSFIDALARGPRHTEIVRTIIVLGKALGKHVIAEGIENAAQLQVLRQLGCESVQGFYLSPPISGDRIQGLLMQRNEDARAAEFLSCVTS
jgi:diguanylate cyclase (GGDEF)-like protein/PAS domain S-box-containing protein